MLAAGGLRHRREAVALMAGCFRAWDGHRLALCRVVSDRFFKALISRRGLARPKRFELLTPRLFVVWCSIGRVLDSRLIPEDGSPPRNETMRHEPDRHSPALDFERSRLNRMRNPNAGGCVNAREIETLGSYVVAAFAPQQLILL